MYLQVTRFIISVISLPQAYQVALRSQYRDLSISANIVAYITACPCFVIDVVIRMFVVAVNIYY